MVQSSDTTNRELDVQGFGELQYSPGALLRGAFWDWPSAGGVGWQLDMTWDWTHDRLYTMAANIGAWPASARTMERSMAMGHMGRHGLGLESKPSRHRTCPHRWHSWPASAHPWQSKPGTVATIGARVGVPGWTGKLRRFRLRIVLNTERISTSTWSRTPSTGPSVARRISRGPDNKPRRLR